MNQDVEQLLDAIRRMKVKYPDWRIGQLVVNVAHWRLGPETTSVWDIEDDDFIKQVDIHLNKTL